MQVLDSQERDLREATEAAEEQKARERAAQDYIRVQWWTENDSVPEHFRIPLRRSRSTGNFTFFHPIDDPGLRKHLQLESLPSFHVWDEELQSWVVTFASSAPLRIRWGGTLYCKHVGVKQGDEMPMSRASASRVSPLKRARRQSTGDHGESASGTPPPRLRVPAPHGEGGAEQPITVSESEDEDDGSPSLRFRTPASSPSRSSPQPGSGSLGKTSQGRAPPGRNGWPLMYACDMSVGFDAMLKLGGSRAEGFSKAFPGYKFKRSTFDENRQRWMAMNDEERRVMVAAGRTVSGLWTLVPSVASVRSSVQKDSNQLKRLPKLENNVFFGGD
ncbi:hypothetical protein FRC04_007128 [Tulasnella sp. 424]|nr:hypothetical protein FRC04_007128 [Tulasnella sp. 424]KAG8961981.1 hypothetical protein FRC05_005647 [Tulasnella sp. 425]